MRYVIYTAIAGGYENLKTQRAQTGVDYVAFTEEAPQATSPWRVQPLPAMDHRDPCRRAKLPKVLSHIVLPSAEYSLWIDGSMRIVSPCAPLSVLARRYLANVDLAVFSHPYRNCLYEEARVVQEWRLDDSEVVSHQIERYRSEGFPERAGLVEACVILRRHTPNIAAFNEAWWSEIQMGSRRDQVSFPYVAWKLGLRYATLAARERRSFHMHRHLKARSKP